MMNIDDIDLRFSDTVFVVEATGFEKLTLWTQHSTQGSWYLKHDPKRRRYEWEQDNHGIWYQIGELDGLPVAINFNWFKIDGHRVVFYELMSRVIDKQMVDEWFAICCSPKWDGSRLAHCNAMNFHHCLNAVDDLNGKR